MSFEACPAKNVAYQMNLGGSQSSYSRSNGFFSFIGHFAEDLKFPAKIVY